MEKDSESGYYIVPAGDAASLILAFNAASSEKGAKIFLPNGTYDLGETTLTTISGTNVSLIGESADKTIIRNAPPVSMEGLGKADLLVNTGTGLYMQDLTLKNDLDYYTAGTGRAPTLHDQGTKTVCKNVRQLSYQDTYYSHKAGGLFYFDGGEIHGTVDYICGNGTVYFNGVTLVNEKRNSATISANSELYVFNNCTVENNADEYNFGRAWNDHPVCIFLNTKLMDPDKLIATRWNLSGIGCDYSKAGEYGTVDAKGTNITPASNNITFTKENTALETILQAEEVAKYTIDKVLGTWAATAQEQATQLEAPDAVYAEGNVTWTPANNGATAYLIEKNSEFVGITTGSSMAVEATATDQLTIRAANARGGFGEAKVVSNTTDIQAAVAVQERGEQVIHNLQGVRVTRTGKGVYIINGKKVVR
jgi:pectin methylesterase-like acyl-CoA thioesterase